MTEIDQFYLDCFWDLNSCRRVGMSLGSIPWDSIYLYATDHLQFPPNLRGFFIKLIRTLDNSYLEWIEKSRSKDNSG